MKQFGWNRRDFLKAGIQVAGAATNVNLLAAARPEGRAPASANSVSKSAGSTRFENETLSRVAYPLGGIGAGMICLDGSGSLSNISIRNRPDLFNEPCVFAALFVRGKKGTARVLEGPLPSWNIFGMPDSGQGEGDHTYGFPRFSNASFSARFRFGTVLLSDPEMPVTAELTGWSPFTPGDANNSSLPVIALEYQFTNPTKEPIDAVFSFNAKNFLPPAYPPPDYPQAVRKLDGGFLLWSGGTQKKPWDEAAFAVTTSEPGVEINYTWFRGGWYDALTMAWKDIANGAAFDRAPVKSDEQPSPGATLFVPFKLAPGDIEPSLCACAGMLRKRISASELRVHPMSSKSTLMMPRIGRGMPTDFRISRRLQSTAATTTETCAPTPRPLPTPSTTPHYQQRSSTPWRATSPF